MDPAPFVRGAAFPGTKKVPYPRAKADDAFRLPVDTWWQAQIPAGVRLELAGDAEEIEIEYRTRTEPDAPRGDAAGATFSSWRGGEKAGEARAEVGEGKVRVPFGEVVYLPAAMRPTVLAVDGVGGPIEPTPVRPRWIAYGDSVVEGWNASEPALAWPAIAGREHGLDVVNMGYAGAARGEIVSAEHIAEADADVVSISHGTNCWQRVPHSVGMMREALAAFLEIVRQGHPDTPIVVASPVVRPDAEDTPNRLGATLADLREAMEDVASERDDVTLVRGRELLGEEHLADGIHPNDEGHRRLAEAIGGRVRAVLDGKG